MTSDKGGAKAPGKEAGAKEGFKKDDSEPLPAAVAAATEAADVANHCRTAELLLRLSAVQYVLGQMRPRHDALMNDNWVYLLLFVSTAVLYKAAVLIVTFPIINLQIARFVDSCLAKALTAALDRYPYLKCSFQSERGLSAEMSRLLHGKYDKNFTTSMTIGWFKLTATVMALGLRAVSLVMNSWAGAFVTIKKFLNDGRDLTSVPIDEVPLTSLKMIIAFFWRLPFNVMYSWLASPLLVQPAGWAAVASRHMQAVASGVPLGGGGTGSGSGSGSGSSGSGSSGSGSSGSCCSLGTDAAASSAEAGTSTSASEYRTPAAGPPRESGTE